MTDAEEFPQTARVAAMRDDMIAIEEFIQTSGFILAKWEEGADGSARLRENLQSPQRVVMDYFDIDYRELGNERRRLAARRPVWRPEP